MNMIYKIDVYNRQKDGNRGTKITTSKYATEQEARQARFVLKNLYAYRGPIPHDSEAVKLHKPAITNWQMKNIIVTEPEKVN